MKKILLIALSLSVLLFACAGETKKITNENINESIEEEKVDVPSSLEEWKLTLDHSDWYKEIKETGEVLFERFLDFNGDGIDDPTIDYIVLFGFDNLLVRELEEVIDQKLEIETSYNFMTDEHTTYANFLFDGYSYHAEITPGEHDVIDSLLISNDIHDE